MIPRTLAPTLLVLAIGRARVPGTDRVHFNMPTDVAVLPDGSNYVSDRYENSRIVKFSSAGEYQFEWGRKGSAPGAFDLPRATDVDAAGRVYVADRSNARVQVFDATGNFLAQWRARDRGRPYSIAVLGDRAVVVDGGDQPERGPDRSGAAESISPAASLPVSVGTATTTASSSSPKTSRSLATGACS